MDSVFSHIRRERKKHKLTLEQLAKDTGLSKSFLSQVERGQAEPSITSLKKIAGRFGMSLVDLFSQCMTTNPTPRATEMRETERAKYVKEIELVRRDQRKRFMLPGSHIAYEMVIPDLRRCIQVLYLQFDPGEQIGDDPISDPRGEKCFLLLRGSVEYRLGDETFRLNAGDSIYFPAELSQYWRGVGTEHIEAVVMMTPPWF
jgi:transcriptional regulator with XRE-family HTH domain